MVYILKAIANVAMWSIKFETNGDYFDTLKKKYTQRRLIVFLNFSFLCQKTLVGLKLNQGLIGTYNFVVPGLSEPLF